MVKDLLVYIIMNTVFYRSVEVEKIFEKLINLGQFCQSLVPCGTKVMKFAIYDPLTQRCIIPTLKRTTYIRSPEWLRWTKNPATSTSWSEDDFFELLQHNFHKTTYIITFILRMKLMRKDTSHPSSMIRWLGLYRN